MSVNFPVVDASAASVTGRVPLTVGTAVTAGRALCVICSVAGNVAVTFANASIGIYPVALGMTVFPFAATQVNTSGTTATATYENWI